MKLHNVFDKLMEKKLPTASTRSDLFADDFKSAIVFDLGEIEILESSVSTKKMADEIDGFIHLPFNKTIYRFKSGNDYWFLFCKVKQDKIMVEIISYFEKSLFSCGYFVQHKEEDKAEIYSTAKDSFEMFGNFASSVLRIIAKTNIIMSCKNVRTVDNMSPEKLNKKRVKNGKLPIFTYKTLHFCGPQENSVEFTERCFIGKNSPRVHLRRGHVRAHKTAGNIWVSECVVGCPEKGLVAKDYAIALKQKPDEEVTLN